MAMDSELTQTLTPSDAAAPAVAGAHRIYRDSVTRARPARRAVEKTPTVSANAPSAKTEQAVRALIDRHALEKDGWWRKMSATLALLKYARMVLDDAETKIRAQQERIGILEDLATADDLTGLKNRRGLFESFAREMDLCQRNRSRGGLLVMIDLDNFKTINDTYGHLAGDACLRLVGRTLQNEIRTMDTAARSGGDEFILLLSNTTKGEAVARAQSIAAQLNNLSLAWYGDIIPIRASTGLRAFAAGDRIETILHGADTAMYQDKESRRRRRGSFPQGTPQTKTQTQPKTQQGGAKMDHA